MEAQARNFFLDYIISILGFVLRKFSEKQLHNEY